MFAAALFVPEVTQMPTNGNRDIGRGIVSQWDEQRTTTYNVGDLIDVINLSKTEAKDYILYNSIYMKYKNRLN